MLHKIVFCLSGKVDALHLNNSAAKAYLCNQSGTMHLFFLNNFAKWPPQYMQMGHGVFGVIIITVVAVGIIVIQHHLFTEVLAVSLMGAT